MNTHEISFVVLIYNTSFEKIEITLESILAQKNINYNIVICDDGSTVDYTSNICKYFLKKGYSDYKIIRQDNNVGTVKNCIRGLKESDGKYVKLLSPGDYLAGETVIREWIDYIIGENIRWSFSNIIYYKKQNGRIIHIEKNTHPRMTLCYKKKYKKEIQYNYTILGDTIVGASVISEKELLIKYLTSINSIIKYAEDYAYRLMIWDDIYPGYFSTCAIYYEVGSGISTSKNRKWMRILHNEWDAISSIILKSASHDKYKEKLIKKLACQLKLKKVGHIIRVIERSCRVLFEHQKINNAKARKYRRKGIFVE